MHDLVALLETDSNAANALGALASAAAAILALFVSVVSVVISLWALKVQRRHNVLSVRPLPEVTVADYEDSIRVKVRNNGAGPMIIRGVGVTDGNTLKDGLIDWMPPLLKGRPWNTFSHALKQRTLLPGGEIGLLELTEHEGEHGFSTSRDRVRKALSILTVEVLYTDVYESDYPKYSKPLNWFGRHEQ